MLNQSTSTSLSFQVLAKKKPARTKQKTSRTITVYSLFQLLLKEYVSRSSCYIKKCFGCVKNYFVIMVIFFSTNLSNYFHCYCLINIILTFMSIIVVEFINMIDNFILVICSTPKTFSIFF